jgi:hypothetical protein
MTRTYLTLWLRSVFVWVTLFLVIWSLQHQYSATQLYSLVFKPMSCPLCIGVTISFFIMAILVVKHLIVATRALLHANSAGQSLLETSACLFLGCLSIWSLFIVALPLNLLFMQLNVNGWALNELVEESPWLIAIVAVAVLYDRLSPTHVSLSWALGLGSFVSIFRAMKYRGYVSSEPDPLWGAVTIIIPTASPLLVAIASYVLISQRKEQ